MNTTKSMVILFFVSFLLLSALSINLVMPANTYAHPPLGLTPQPEPPPPVDDDGDTSGGRPTTDGGENEPSDHGQTPTDIIDIQLDRCGLDAIDTNQTADLVASAGSDMSLALLPSVATPTQPLPEVLAPVQLVHQGSGWIATGTLSSQATTRFVVPYPGRWNVLLVEAPIFNTAELVDVTGLNLAELHNSLGQNPIPLGIVEANAGQTQFINCPITRVSPNIFTEPAAVVANEKPVHLPTTGQASLVDLLAVRTIMVANIILVSLMIFGGYRGLKSRSK